MYNALASDPGTVEIRYEAYTYCISSREGKTIVLTIQWVQGYPRLHMAHSEPLLQTSSLKKGLTGTQSVYEGRHGITHM